MTTIKTPSGFEADVDERVIDDLAFLDLICDLDDGNPHAYRGLIDKLLSADDRKRLYDHVRTDDGRTPVSAINEELTEIIKGLKNGKK